MIWVPSFDSLAFQRSTPVWRRRVWVRGGSYSLYPLPPLLRPNHLILRSQTLSSSPDAVDITAFFLGDGILASDAKAIRPFLRNLVTGFASIGMDVALHKTEVIPTCSASQTFSPSDFPGYTWTATRNFKLLV